MNRREFLKISSALSLGGPLFTSLLTSQAAVAQASPIDHFFMLMFFPGGWDTTLCLDPWIDTQRPAEKELFLEYRADEVFQVGNNFFGPAMTAMKPYLSQCSVINGLNISTSDNGHAAAKTYMTTGAPHGRAGVLGSEIDQASAIEAPFGSLYNQSFYSGKKSPKMIDLTTVDTYKSGKFFMAETLLAGANVNTHSSELVDLQKNYASHLALMKEVGQDLVANPFAGAARDIQEAWRAAICFKHGAARTCFFEISMSPILDTHANHRKTHLSSLTTGWNTVAGIFKIFQNTPFGQGSLFDATTFAVVSEFSRTSPLNAAQGKDHNPLTNSILLAGRDIKKGLRIGASKFIDQKKSPNGLSYQIAMPFDFETGQAIDSKDFASFIAPENIARTLGEIFSVDFQKFESCSSQTKAIKSLMSSI